MKIGVVALGSWGTAIAQLLAVNGHQVVGYARDGALLRELDLKRENTRYLPGVRLHSSIVFSERVRDAAEDMDIVVSAVPTQGFRSAWNEYREWMSDRTVLVNLAKGIEISSGLTLSHVADTPRYVALSGPTHAEEVGLSHPSAIVAASSSAACAELVQKAFSCANFRVYTSADIKGVEIAGALKNIIALAAGIVDGIGYGDNAKAALITRGLAEITRFGVSEGADRDTFSGLAGVGDMIVTCGSRHSRNLKCGQLLGSGLRLEEAIRKVGMVVEGVHTLKAVHAKKGDVEMPITEMLYRVLYEDFSATQAIRILMTRKTKNEKE